MPLITIESNQILSDTNILKTVSQTIAQMLGKPESYVMVKYNYNESMLFAGSGASLAYIELKSLGLPENQTADFSETVCQTISEMLQIPTERIYIEFSSPERHMWGWNKSTF